MQHKNAIIKPKSTTFLESQTFSRNGGCRVCRAPYVECAWMDHWLEKATVELSNTIVCLQLFTAHDTHKLSKVWILLQDPHTAAHTLCSVYSLCACTHARTHVNWDEARYDVLLEMCFRFEAKRQSQPMAAKLTTGNETERQPSGSVVHQNISNIIHNLNAGAGAVVAACASAFFLCLLSLLWPKFQFNRCQVSLMHCIHTQQLLSPGKCMKYTYKTHPNRFHTVNSTAFVWALCVCVCVRTKRTMLFPHVRSTQSNIFAVTIYCLLIFVVC